MFGDSKKRKRHDLLEKMKLEIILLKSTVNVHELRISELEDKNSDLESERYSLSIEMKMLKTLCEQKLSNIEQENRCSDETGKIKEMVCSILYSIFYSFYFIHF